VILSPLPLPDLHGAFGDITWAADVPDETREGAPAMTVLVLADDHELVTHRLLLSGYTQADAAQAGRSLWSRYDGALVEVLEAPETWGREALAAATRNRDARGAPHLTRPFVLLMRLQWIEPGDEAAFDAITAGSTEEELREVRDLLSRIAVEGGASPDDWERG
jgi:hypothetical protein